MDYVVFFGGLATDGSAARLAQQTVLHCGAAPHLVNVDYFV